MFVKTTRETKKTVIGHLQPKWTYAKVTRKETPEKTIAEQQGHILANQIASCFFELTSKLMTLHHINRAFVWFLCEILLTRVRSRGKQTRR